MGAPEHGAGRASARPHRMGIPFRACIGSLCLRCGHLLPPSLHDHVLSFILRSGPLIDLKNKTQGGVGSTVTKRHSSFIKTKSQTWRGRPWVKCSKLMTMMMIVILTPFFSFLFFFLTFFFTRLAKTEDWVGFASAGVPGNCHVGSFVAPHGANVHKPSRTKCRERNREGGSVCCTGYEAYGGK